MAQVQRMAAKLGDSLNERRRIFLDLPEFAIRALEYRADVANEEAAEEEEVTFQDVAEWYLLSPLSVKEMPQLEAAVPGFTSAFTRWLFNAMYSPPE